MCEQGPGFSGVLCESRAQLFDYHTLASDPHRLPSCIIATSEPWAVGDAPQCRPSLGDNHSAQRRHGNPRHFQGHH